MIQQRFVHCVGASLEDACLLASRFEPRRDSTDTPDADCAEAWLGRVRDGRIVDAIGSMAPVSLIGASPSGEVVALADRAVVSGRVGEWPALWICADQEGAFGARPVALEAIDVVDGRVLADGSTALFHCSPGSSTRLIVHDRGLRRLPFPPLRLLTALHGVDAHWLVAGSAEGSVAIYVRDAWTRSEVLGPDAVLAVCARAPDDAYATTASALWHWDGTRWTSIARPPEPLEELAFRDGELIALGSLATYRLDAGSLAAIGEGGERLHVGARAVLITRPDAIFELGAEGRRIELGALEGLLADRRPLWRTAAIDSERARFRAPHPRVESAEDPVRWWFDQCVGASLDGAAFLSARSEVVDRYDADVGESIIGRIDGGLISAVTIERARVRSLHRLPSGRLYLAAFADGGVWRSTRHDNLDWEPMGLPPMQGLFALDDECVMAWTGRGTGLEQDFHLWNGARFDPIPSPPARVMAMHGVAPDWIVAVGFEGMIARWDGRAWRPWTVSLRGALGSIHVVSPDEMYATGPAGVLLEGSQYGWAVRAPTLGSAVSVTKLGVDVLVGDPVLGLLRLEQDRLVPLPVAHPWQVHAGDGALLMTETQAFAETRDFESVRRITVLDLEYALRDRAPSWRA